MKKATCVLLAVLLLSSASLASSYPFELTDAILQSAFGDPKWAAYRPVLYAMNAVDKGSGVVVMGDADGHNILCVIEPGAEGWRIVIENEEIVPDAVFLDAYHRPDLMWMTDGSYYSFSLFPYRYSKQGDHTLAFRKNAQGEWVIRGFSYVPGYAGEATHLGYAQFGLYEGGDLPEGKLHCYAGNTIDASVPLVVDRRVIDRDETGLSFKLSEFVLRDYVTALLGLYCDDAAIERMLSYPVTNAEMAAACRARYEASGDVYALYEAFVWEHGFFFTWDPEDWVAFEAALSDPFQETTMDVTSYEAKEIHKFSMSGYRMPREGELSYDEALAVAKRLLAEHPTDWMTPDLEGRIARAVLIGTPPGGLPPMWKFSFFTANYQDGLVIQFDAQSGEETDWFFWDSSVLARDVPFIYTEAGVMAENLEAWYAWTKYYYYNPDGGKYYHEDPECQSVSSRFLPMRKFLRTDVAKESYRLLSPCPYCVD